MQLLPEPDRRALRLLESEIRGTLCVVEDLHITDDLTIPGSELEERFDTSGGPGGQHANRSATRVVLSFDVAASGALHDALRQRVLATLGTKASGGVVSVSVDESRSQWRNRQLARRQLAALLAAALRPPPPPRKATKPSRAARQRRLEEKRARSRIKRLRRRPDLD